MEGEQIRFTNSGDSENHLVTMGIQVIFLAVKPIDWGLSWSLLRFTVLSDLDHAQVIEATAYKALHALVLKSLLMGMRLQIQILVLQIELLLVCII